MVAFHTKSFHWSFGKKKNVLLWIWLDQPSDWFQTKSLDDLGVKTCPPTATRATWEKWMHFIYFFIYFGLGDLFYFLQLACLCMLIWGARLLLVWWRPIGIENRELTVENKQVPLLSFPAGQLLCISPPGGGVPVPPLPIHWYYIMAAGGALLLLAVAILVRALCCCRQHLATKKSQLSVAYHSSSQCFQYSNWSSSMAAPGVEPVLTVRLDSRDRHRTLCWKEALSCVVFGRAGRQLVMSVAVCVMMPQDWQNIHSTKTPPSFSLQLQGWWWHRHCPKLPSENLQRNTVLSLSQINGCSFGCCFLLCSIKEFAVDISHYAAPDDRTEVRVSYLSEQLVSDHWVPSGSS